MSKKQYVKQVEINMRDTIDILVVEDDSDINNILCTMLRRSGYEAKAAYSGTEAMMYIEDKKWDMVLLDLMLPGLTGEEVLAKIRESSQVPIIIISAKNEREVKLDLLKTGADDFILKPFDLEEVEARIISHLRRYLDFKEEKQEDAKILTYKDIELNIEEKEVFVREERMELTVIEYKILELLLMHPKKVFSKANLFESVWGEEFLGDDNTVNVHISKIRSKLAKGNPDEEYIETIWGMGYKLR